ncbi:MAG: aquaporin [Candidatus Paracaedibacteraceae bacterium]|nr:aquaporin [Candidatus Paracaedibacteraceae bacterium]
MQRCDKVSRYGAEFLGAGILVMMGVGSAVFAGPSIGALGIGLTFGLTLMFLIYMIGTKSGCHINPAVTLMMFLTGHTKLIDAIFYIIAQLAGGIVGAYAIYMVAMGKAEFSLAAGFASNGFAEHSPAGYSMHAVMLVEFLMTSVLLMAVASTLNKDFPAGFSGLVVGLVLVAIHLVSLPVSNTSVNVARSLGSAFIEGGWAMQQLWVFAVAQAAAAVFVAALHKCFLGCSRCSE